MDKQPVGQLPDLTQSNNDDEIMVITDSEYNQLKKEKISDFITDLTSTNKNNAIVKGTDGKLFTKDFGNASNITEGTLPVSVLPDSGITAGTYTYPTDIVVNSKGQVTSITEGQPGANNANQDLSNLSTTGEAHFANPSLNNLSEIGQAVLDNKLDITQIYSSVLQIPNKFTVVNNGAASSGSNSISFTLKAGSVLTNANGTTYTVNADENFTLTPGQIACLNTADGNAGGTIISNCFSGTTAPASATTNAFWLDTANKQVKRKTSSGTWATTFTLPFMFFDYNGKIKLFNSFGFIGSSLFSLPGIKTLHPKGKNADGTLNNFVNETTDVQIITNPYGNSPSGEGRVVINSQGNLGITYRYVESKEEPATTYTTWFNPETNEMKYAGATAQNWQETNNCIIGKPYYNYSSGVNTFYDVDIYTPFIAANYYKTAEKNKVLNKTRITNCVLEIPFNLKIEEIEAENYTITLKSGSKAALPDGTLYTFTQDNNINVTDGTLLFYNPGTSGFGATSIDNCFSGSTAPASATTNAFWFDTANMQIKRKTSSGDWTTGWTMPLCHNNGEEIKVFNGFGYVGATQFILPGVKFLIPNGRNADGTLNNTVYTTGNVVFQTYNYYTAGRNQGVIFRSTGGLIRYSEYYESDIEPEPVSFCAWLDTKNNQMKFCLSAGNGWEVMPGAVFAEEVVNNTSYQIQSIRFKKPVELVKKEEMDIIFKSPKVQSYGIIQYGSPTLSNNILSNFSQTNYVRANTLFYPDTTTWEMNFLITTSSDVSSTQTFCSSDYNILEIGISNDKHYFIEINGGSWVKGTYTVLADTTYYVKVKYTGTQYILSYSLNGSTYTSDITYDMTTPLNLENRNPFIYYGKDYNNNNEIFSGTIDLTGCNIIVDDYLIWQGVRNYNNTEYPTKNRPAVVVQAFVNGTSGYRVWSDRYCEQWGYAESVKKSATIITLPLAMSNGNYNIICTGTEAQGGGDNGSMNAYNVSATGFSIYNTSDVVSNAYWRVFGYRK